MQLAAELAAAITRLVQAYSGCHALLPVWGRNGILYKLWLRHMSTECTTARRISTGQDRHSKPGDTATPTPRACIILDTWRAQRPVHRYRATRQPYS